jgi:Ner family transcriptional regulator
MPTILCIEAPLDRFEIKAAIERKGGSLSSIALAADLDGSSCRGALRYPIPAGNKAIADFLNTTVHALWPDWYDTNGDRRPDVSSATLRRAASSQNGRAA